MNDRYIDNYSLFNKLHRLLWNISWQILIRPFGLPIFIRWRNGILKLFGARIGKGSIVHASTKIWAPWNLEIGDRTCIGPHSIIYNPGKIKIGKKVVISQYAYLCTATHYYTSLCNPLYWKDIIIDNYVWVAARAFVAPGVHLGEGSIIGACAVQTKDSDPWGIYVGNPAKIIKRRTIIEGES